MLSKLPTRNLLAVAMIALNFRIIASSFFPFIRSSVFDCQLVTRVRSLNKVALSFTLTIDAEAKGWPPDCVQM